MKEKMNKFKEWMTKVRKQALIIAIALLLVIGGVIAGGMLMDQNRQVQASKATEEPEADLSPEDTAEEEALTGQAEAETAVNAIGKAADAGIAEGADAVKLAQAEEKKKAEEAKAAQAEEAQKKKEPSEQTAQTQQKTSGSGSSRASSSGSSGQRHQHNYNIPIYGEKQVYVVEQAAWTETVEEPIYKTQEIAVCNTCGKDISGYAGEHLDDTMHDGYHSEVKQVQTGTDTYTINHPEEGHYETETYVAGYKCSCGATK